MSALRNRALELLAQGVAQTQVANVLGVSDGAISQLMGDEDFAAELSMKRVAISEKDESFDKTLDTAEETALEGIVSRVRFGNLGQQLAAFKILNSAKRRKDTRGNTTAQIGHVTTLIVNQVVMPTYVQNTRNEIIEVDGKSLLSASTARLNEIVKEKTGVEIGMESAQLSRTAERLEAITRSVVQPVRRAVKRIAQPQVDVVDLL